MALYLRKEGLWHCTECLLFHTVSQSVNNNCLSTYLCARWHGRFGEDKEATMVVLLGILQLICQFIVQQMLTGMTGFCSVIWSFHKHLIRTFYEPEIVLGARETALTKSEMVPVMCKQTIYKTTGQVFNQGCVRGCVVKQNMSLALLEGWEEQRTIHWAQNMK